MRRVWAMLAVCLLALPARAQQVDVAMAGAFDTWLVQHGTTGILASAQRAADGVWHATRKAQFNAPPTGELASVSKSITAVCVLSLVQDGRLFWSDRLPDILGPSPDVSVGALITHTSGLSRDSTQMNMPGWLDQAPDTGGHVSAEVLNSIVARKANVGNVGQYIYNNENYALLGLLIEAVTGQPMFDYCRAALDLPDGIAPSPRTGGMLPWGGFVADPIAYLSFLHSHFGADSTIGTDPFSLPHVEIAEGVYYGLGMVFRSYGEGFNFWHFGALCFPGRLNTGSFAVLWDGRMSALAIWDACVEWDAMAQLDGALGAAAFGRAR